MAPKKKQAGKNGFYYFMLDFKEKESRHFSNMTEVADAAGPHWKNLSKEERRPYEIRAQMRKNNARAGKFTSEGLDVEVLENIDREEQRRVEEMKEEINEELKMASRAGRIPDKKFFLIHLNTFCYCSNFNRHYPAEIAIASFSLESGVLPDNVFHRLIKPGSLPLGFAGVANLHSKETHQIQPPMSDNNEINMEEVYLDMKEFLQSNMEGSKRMPILYCEQRHMKMVQLVLDTWSMDYDEGHTLFKVYNLQYLFRILRNTVAGDNVWPSDTFSAREIEKDVNAYAKGICCDYHDQSNVPVYCSRSVVVRYAFTICDNCCPDLNIPLMPGNHVPSTALIAAYSRPSSVASGVSYKSSYKGGNSSVREDDAESVMSFSSKSEWENESLASEPSFPQAVHEEEDFPSLGKTRRRERPSSPSWNRFSSNDASSLFSQSSTRSYAGATGTAGLSRRPADMPSGLNNEKLSLDSLRFSDTRSGGRGMPTQSFHDVGNFPALGRGRSTQVSRGRGLRRPNPNN